MKREGLLDVLNISRHTLNKATRTRTALGIVTVDRERGPDGRLDVCEYKLNGEKEWSWGHDGHIRAFIQNPKEWRDELFAQKDE